VAYGGVVLLGGCGTGGVSTSHQGIVSRATGRARPSTKPHWRKLLPCANAQTPLPAGIIDYRFNHYIPVYPTRSAWRRRFGRGAAQAADPGHFQLQIVKSAVHDFDTCNNILNLSSQVCTLPL